MDRQLHILDGHPLMKLLIGFRDFLPGISSIMTVYYDLDENRLRAMRIRYRNEGPVPEPVKIDDQAGYFSQLRTEKINYTWVGRQDVPFEINEKKAPQFDIFSEMQNLVLLVRLQNPADNKYDLIYIYFESGGSYFWLPEVKGQLSVENKAIIGYLLYHSIRFSLAGITEERKENNILGRMTRNALQELSGYKKELEKTRRNYTVSITDLFLKYVEEHCLNNRLNWSLSREAREKLAGYSGDIDRLKEIAQLAVAHARMLNVDGKNNITIEEWNIQFDEITKDEAIKPDQINRYDKTINLLDRLEEAARTVVMKNLRLTGTNVGSHCETSISAPAITDALKNHRNKIRYLAGQYPEKWPTITRNFKPVINVLEKRD